MTHKLYYLVRKDIVVSRGKLIVHAGHVTDTLFYHLIDKQGNPDCNLYERWSAWYHDNYQTKIVLGVKNETQLVKLSIKAAELDLPFVMIHDEGIYEVEPGTTIMGAVGPLNDEERIKLGLKRLSLYRGSGA